MNYFLIFTAFFLINYDMEDAFWNALAKAGGSSFLFALVFKEAAEWLVIITKAILKH